MSYLSRNGFQRWNRRLNDYNDKRATIGTCKNARDMTITMYGTRDLKECIITAERRDTDNLSRKYKISILCNETSSEMHKARSEEFKKICHTLETRASGFINVSRENRRGSS